MRTRCKSQKLLESLGELVTTLEVPLTITLVTITTFKPETLVEMSVENPELSLQMLLHSGQVILLTSIAILVEMSDEDLITILSTNTLRRHEKSLTGSGRCTTTKTKQPSDNCYNLILKFQSDRKTTDKFQQQLWLI